MAWLQTSFTGNHLQGDGSGSSLRKGYKSAPMQKTDPDKSDTPLLQGTLQSPENDTADSDWNIEPNNASAKKLSFSFNYISKPSFLSSGLFDKGGIGAKSKSQSNARESLQETGCKIFSKENKKLLNEVGSKKADNVEDNEDEESEDEWCMPRSDGYQKVRLGAD